MTLKPIDSKRWRVTMAAAFTKGLLADAIRAGIMNGTLPDGFPSASSTGPKRSPSSSVNVFLSMGLILAGHEELAKAILLSPALQRLDTVFRHHWLAIVPAQAISQCETVLHPIRRHRRLINNMRFHLKMLVRAEKSVVDEIAVVARDVGGLPDRIQRLQLGVRHEAEGLSACLGVNGRAAQGDTDGRSPASDHLSATNAGHARVPLAAFSA